MRGQTARVQLSYPSVPSMATTGPRTRQVFFMDRLLEISSTLIDMKERPMRIPLATLMLTLALSLPGLPSADVYKCPDPSGRQHYQNRPCEGADEPAIISPGPGSQYRGPALPLRPQAYAVPQSASVQEEGKTAAGGPVDTREFGMLEIGSSEARVLAKLGQPDRIFEAARTFVPVRRAGVGSSCARKSARRGSTTAMATRCARCCTLKMANSSGRRNRGGRHAVPLWCPGGVFVCGAATSERRLRLIWVCRGTQLNRRHEDFHLTGCKF